MRWLVRLAPSMMRPLLLLGLTGCLATTQTVRTVPRGSYAVPEILGPVAGVGLDVTESYSTLHVIASHRRACVAVVRHRFERRTVTVTAGEKLAAATIILAVLAGQFGDAMSAEDASTPTWVEPFETVDVHTRDCSLVGAHVDFDVVLPSGNVVHATTNGFGLAHVKIPAAEPATGTAVVRAGETAVRIAYSPAH